jgi:(E)-4-hydroxy-3-methylbut-2-enyl-diphosphate synthase
MTLPLKKTRKIMVGGVQVGGGAPVTVQSMTNTLTTDIKATCAQIKALQKAGCDIVRVSVPDEESLAAFAEIKKKSDIPVIADIHFDYRLAVGAIIAGADCIRINPGNIGSREKVRKVAKAAIDNNVPVRVGVNMGSVKRSALNRFGKDRVGALVETAQEQVRILEDFGLDAIKVSLKSSDVLETVEAYRRFSSVSDRPLHLGVTEAGTMFSGAIRSAVGIGILLEEGIGDTIRVSLSSDPVKEILAGRVILECLGLRKEGIRVISCPTCARANADVARIAAALEDSLSGIKRHLVVAVMGCIVNGPGEARHADIGVACDTKGAMLFMHGKPVRRINSSDIIKTITDEIKKECKE